MRLRGGAALLLVAGPVAAQDVEAVLHNAEETYGQITTLRADFTQTLTNPMMGTEVTRGVLFLSPPHR